jgi:hypothetical protein
MLKLARELELMRDSLVELSLMLKDYQLLLNGRERVEANCVLEKLLSRFRHSH